jgi:hypothetical protein
MSFSLIIGSVSPWSRTGTPLAAIAFVTDLP